MGARPRELLGVASALAAYRRSVLPAVRSELRGWERAAAAIPDPVLRGHALAALREKAGNAEATAVFAILAPRATRRAAVRAIAALQVAVDYLDTLGEQKTDDVLANGLQLHGALVDALSPGAPTADWYRLNPRREDGGYLGNLVSRCRETAGALPAAAAALPAARRAARRCGEGQSHTHAAARGQREALERWASRLPAPPGYEWWEVAAGASSSVAAHALIAAAADRRTGAGEAALVEAAYCPPIGALTVLLDDLVDLDEDRAAGAHSYIGYYAGSDDAAHRLAFLARRARAAIAGLPRAGRHAAILAGVAGFYLAAPTASNAYARPVREALIDALGPAVPAIVAATRRRRR